MIPHKAACQFIFIFKSELSQFPVCFFSIMLKIFWQSFSKMSLGKAAQKPAKKQKASYTSGSRSGCLRRFSFPMRLMLQGSNVWLPQHNPSACLLWAMDGYTKVLEKLLKVKNIEICTGAGGRGRWYLQGCSHKSITESAHEGQVAVLRLLFALSVLFCCKPYQLCIARWRDIWLVASEYCSQHWDGYSLPSTASTSWVKGPALPQVAKPEPLFIIYCYTVKNRVNSLLTGFCKRRSYSCPHPR